jgi:hypothetical protein
MPGQPTGHVPVGAVTACLAREAAQDRAALEASASGNGGGGGGGGGGADEGGDDEEGAEEGSGASGDDDGGGERRRRRLAGKRAGGGGGGSAASEREGQGRAEPFLSPSCLAFLDLALPPDGLAAFRDGLAAAAMVTQLASIESSLGLSEGTLHNPGELRWVEAEENLGAVSV